LLLASDQTFPSITAFADDLLGVLLVLAFTTESELVFGLAIWNLVDTEPFVGRSEEARKMTLNIFDVVQLGCKGVVDIDDDDLPIRLFLVEKCHDTEDLDLLDLASVAYQFTDFADIQRVIVTLGLGLGMNDIGVFPGFWESTIVPQVALVREAVANESELAFFDVLLDGIQEFIFGNLKLRI